MQLYGGLIHGSGSQMASLLSTLDPSLVGAYVDPKNQVVQDGPEEWC